MGITNLKHGLTDKLSRYLGELQAQQENLGRLRQAVDLIGPVSDRIAQLEKLIAGVEFFLESEVPDWERTAVTPVRPRKHRGILPFGTLGPSALAVLRDHPEGLKTRALAEEVLRTKGIENDRSALDKVADSLDRYLQKHRHELVESDGARWGQTWRVIR